MLANSGMRHLAPFAKQAIDNGYVKPTKRVFDNAKVSDHFAIIPTLQAPSGLSEAEQKLYDFVVRRFLSVFFPSAEYQVTTRISTVAHAGKDYNFRSDGKVLVKPGWLAIYGKEAVSDDDEKDGKNLVPVKPGEQVAGRVRRGQGPEDPAAGALFGSDAARRHGRRRQDRSTTTSCARRCRKRAWARRPPAPPSSKACSAEKYMHREGRELIPTAKAFQLMTLLRGLGVEELSKAELTGEWEYKLAQMEHGKLSREAFMREIAEMTQHIVKKAKEYDRDTVPGDYATLATPCPNCGGVVRENYRRYACTGKPGQEPCGFSFGKSPAGRTFEVAEAEALLRDKRIGPLEGFRSKAGWPFTSEIVLKYDEEAKNWKLEFDFGDEKDPAETGEIVDFSGQSSLGPCPKCAARVFEFGSNYVCEKSVPTAEQPTPSCDFKTGKVILHAAGGRRSRCTSCWPTGKTDLLDKFVSMRTRRAFKAFLVWNKDEGKVTFEFEPRTSKFPPRKTFAATKTPTVTAAKKAAAKKAPARQEGAGREEGGRAQGAAQDRRRPDAERRAGRRDRRRAGGAHRGHQEAVGLHQGQRPAGRGQQARHQRRRQAQAGVRQGPGHDVRTGRHRRQASGLSPVTHAAHAELRGRAGRGRAAGRPCASHAGAALAHAGRRQRRAVLLQVRELPAHGRLQVPRRLQRAVVLRRAAAPRRRAGLLLGQPCAGDRAVGAAAGHSGHHPDAAGRAGR